MENPNYKKLIKVLEEVFQLDQADLDFGIYRIMNFKREEILQFLNKDLIPQVKEILSENLSGGKKDVQKELDEAIKAAKGLGMNPDDSPKVQNLRQQLTGATDIESEENAVFAHLANFFKRYYEGGDFISLRRYKEGVYAIPYEGEEVKLHWANHDQYYIKTSEYLKNYAFKLSEKKSVRFLLAEASTEQNNNKATTGKERRFALHKEEPFKVNENELQIFFNYAPTDKKIKQDKLLKDAFEALKTQIPPEFQDVLISNEKSKTTKQPKRTLLEKHLRDYTARNTFDYFIHKNLGKFLRQELDFFIKNEVLYLDDINTRDTNDFVRQLSQVRALKSIGLKIITFLEQLENFQKKLWLKKKFVVETQYCITLDRVPEDLYPEIIENQEQIEEWKRLFHIQDIKAKDKSSKELFEDNQVVTYSEPLSLAFLKANPFLVLDTQFFSDNFKDEIVASMENMDEQLDGLLVNSENFQALNLLQERFREQVKSVYIDPPYNSGGDDFLYKDSFRNSSWLSMLKNRLDLSINIMSNNGVLFTSIDDKDSDNKVTHWLSTLFEDTFGKENYVENIIWAKNTTHNDAKTFSHNHEVIQCYTKNKKNAIQDNEMFRTAKPGYLEVKEFVNELNKVFPSPSEINVELKKFYKKYGEKYKRECLESGLEWNDETKRNDPWKGIKQYKYADYRTTDGTWVDFKNAKKENAKIWVYRESDSSWPNASTLTSSHRDPNSEDYRFYKPIHPITGKPSPYPKTGWRWRKKSKEKDSTSFELLEEIKHIYFGEDENKVPQVKRFLDNVSTNVTKSIILDYNDGEKELTNLTGKSGMFPNPKPTSLISKLIEFSTKESCWVMDYFVGSGSTGQAVINLNRTDNFRRKFLFIEMGSYFDLILMKRIKKIIYSKDWKDGKPFSRQGSSHCFKYVRLESYEDTLNHLAINTTDSQKMSLQENTDFREGYMLNYMLDTAVKGSLLNVTNFEDPFNYHLNITRQNEMTSTKVDMVETFNYLIGLVVERMDTNRGFRVIEGKTLQDERILVIWRNTKEKDNKALNSFFKTMGYSTRDQEFHRIYVNGDNNLENLRTEEDRWKVVMIEEEFKRQMFEVEDV